MTVDPRLYMLAGIGSLVAIALIATLVLLARSARRHRSRSVDAAAAGESQVPDTATHIPVETATDIPHAETSPDSPSADLLAAPHEDGWQPPEPPALAHELESVSLDRRIAEHPAPAEPGWAGSEPVITAAHSAPRSETAEIPLPPATASAGITAPQPAPVTPTSPESPAVALSVPTVAQRPRAVVRAVDPVLAGGEAHLAPLAKGVAASTQRGDGVPEFVMQAPVEVWFGEERIGVKAGTRTYEEFKRYADTLFEDLKAADIR